jgi:hypothetical protein
MIDGTRRQGKRDKQLLYDLAEERMCRNLK